MEIKIGIARSAGELVISSSQTPDEIQKLISESLADDGGLLTLVDDAGRRYSVPAAHIAYIEVAPADQGS